MTDDQTVLADRYRLGDRLGRGGMAEVRRGFDLRLERSVAVKRLRTELAADPSFQERFRREAHAVAGLNHPGIAAIYDTGEQVDAGSGVPVPFLVMELVDGPTLRDVLRDQGPLPTRRALELMQVVLSALAHSHAAGIVHRDIKPSNIMLTPKGDAKVMDFGIARAAAETTSGLTGTAMVIGTAHYLSPEQARGERVDQRSDVYSAGCVLYELLLGRPPFLGDSSVSVAYQHVREMPVPPSQVDPNVDPAIDAIIAKALAKDPADRYQSAEEMAADIGRVLAGRPVEAGAASLDGRDTRPTVALAAATRGTSAAEADREPAWNQPVGVAVPGAGGPPGTVPPGTDPPSTTAVAVPEELPPEPDRRGRGRAVLVALLTLLVLGGLGFGAYRLLDPGTGRQVSVPSVLGSSRADAEQKLRNVDLQPAFRNVRGPDDDSRDTVVKQTPEPGRELLPGGTVTAEINVGPPTARIPDHLVGRDLDKVLAKLEDAGFTSVIAVPVATPPPGADPDEVVSVEPGEGEKAAPAEDITVRYVGQAVRAPTTAPRQNPTTSRATKSRSTTPTSGSATSESSPDRTGSTGPSVDSTTTTHAPSRSPSKSAATEPSTSASGPEPSASESAPSASASSAPSAVASGATQGKGGKGGKGKPTAKPSPSRGKPKPGVAGESAGTG